MNGDIVAQAPGKLFLIGEYAVLDGCPAVVAAINRFATVTLKRHARPDTVRLVAPELSVFGSYALKSLPPATGALRFPLATLHALGPARRASLSDGIALTISSDLAGNDSPKPGLGSSAAVTVAVAAALLARAGVDVDSAEGRSEVFATAWVAHRNAQGGLGSGADVAASTFGGVVSLILRDGAPPLVQRLNYPRELILLAASSGRSASTADLVARYRALHNGYAARRSMFVRASTENVERFLANLEQPDVILDTLRTAHIELLGLAGDTGLELFTPELTRAIEIAERHGAAAKLSGAGGGDCAIACTADPRAVNEICSDWGAVGLQPLRLSVGTKGVSIAHSEAS